jgi:hypothetical protein
MLVISLIHTDFSVLAARTDTKLNWLAVVGQERALRLFRLIRQDHSRSRWQVPLIPLQLALLQEVLKLPA